MSEDKEQLLKSHLLQVAIESKRDKTERRKNKDWCVGAKRRYNKTSAYLHVLDCGMNIYLVYGL